VVQLRALCPRNLCSAYTCRVGSSNRFIPWVCSICATSSKMGQIVVRGQPGTRVCGAGGSSIGRRIRLRRVGSRIARQRGRHPHACDEPQPYAQQSPRTTRDLPGGAGPFSGFVLQETATHVAGALWRRRKRCIYNHEAGGTLQRDGVPKVRPPNP
jgi:hypothetical protein